MSSRPIVIASRNPGKVEEIRAILQAPNLIWMSLADFPELPEIAEKALTLRENAITKAMMVSQYTDLPALADDSGLEVDALHGQPGVHSARFLGPDTLQETRNQEILRRLQGLPLKARRARFRCVIALAIPDAGVQTVVGVCEGRIAKAARGSGGFGYDPIFLVPEYNRTFAELGAPIKNRISHRAQALRRVPSLLMRIKNEKR